MEFKINHKHPYKELKIKGDSFTTETGLMNNEDIMKEDKIFTAYLNDICPVCGAPVDQDSSTMDHSVNGKFVAREYLCEYCLSEYRVSMGRGLRNIESEILVERGI